MAGRKTVLILTDDAAATKNMANAINAALADHKTKQTEASGFRGNDLLKADVVFLGCEKPNPPSFERMTKLFRHINLAGRSCGIFSPGTPATLTYLTGIVRDSEIRIFEPLLTKDVQKLLPWAKLIMED